MNEILKADFRNARIEDRVKDTLLGNGVISEVIKFPNPQCCGIRVSFENGLNGFYNMKGFIINDVNTNKYEYPSIFYDFEGQFPTIKACTRPLPTIEVDEKVLVWGECTKTWLKGYFKYFDSNDYLCVFENGATSWSTNSHDSKHFKYWKLASDETINSGNLHEIEGENE